MTLYNAGRMNMEYYERIKILRQKNNMSQEDLSKLLGIAQITLSQYERNQRKLPRNFLTYVLYLTC